MRSSTNNRSAHADARRTAPRVGRASLFSALALLGVILVSMLVFFKVVSHAMQHRTADHRGSQALARAQEKIEALRAVPTDALVCLANGETLNHCHEVCLAQGGDVATCREAMKAYPVATSGGGMARFEYGYHVDRIDDSLFDVQVLVWWEDRREDPPVRRRIGLRTTFHRQPHEPGVTDRRK